MEPKKDAILDSFLDHVGFGTAKEKVWENMAKGLPSFKVPHEQDFDKAKTKSQLYFTRTPKGNYRLTKFDVGLKLKDGSQKIAAKKTFELGYKQVTRLPEAYKQLMGAQVAKQDTTLKVASAAKVEIKQSIERKQSEWARPSSDKKQKNKRNIVAPTEKERKQVTKRSSRNLLVRAFYWLMRTSRVYMHKSDFLTKRLATATDPVKKGQAPEHPTDTVGQSISGEKKVNEKSLDYTVQYQKNKEGLYDLNRFVAILRVNGEDGTKETRQHTFKNDNGFKITPQQAGELLSGKSILANRIVDGKIQREWIKLDLTDKDAQGNNKLKMFGKNHQFNVIDKVKKLPLKTKLTDKKAADIKLQLERGKAVPMVLTKSGIDKTVLLRANAATKGIDILDIKNGKVLKMNEVFKKVQGVEQKNKLGQKNGTKQSQAKTGKLVAQKAAPAPRPRMSIK